MYTALYRQYRPEVFDEILGQEHVVRILKNQIATNSVSHAYLFCGTRGTGKTTTARILAKGVNCQSEGERPCGNCSTCQSIKAGTFLDVIEIDAASNNGVENIRELRESVKYPPAVGKKKIYIIDEVHMLSSGAFNALLKTLEEPPEYVMFILATTEPQKLPATILSRCLRLDFRRIPEVTIIDGMKAICNDRGIAVDERAMRIIAANADGSVRDGLSILEQCISTGEKDVTADIVLDFLGTSGEDVFIEITNMVRRKQTSEALVLLAEVLADGKDARQFMKDWLKHYRNLLMTKFVKDPQCVVNMSVENIERVEEQSSSMELMDINRGILELSRTMNEAKWSTQPRILLEMSIVKLSTDAMAYNTGFVQSSSSTGAIQKKNIEVKSVQEIKPHKEIRLKQEQASEKSAEPEDKRSISDNSTLTMDTKLTELWMEVFKKGEAKKSSFYIAGRNSSLTDIGEDYFVVAVKTEHAKSYMESNREFVEELMYDETGQQRVMRIDRSSEEINEKSVDKSIKDIAEEASRILGVDVEIKR